jgi:hypothetical protein
MAAWNSTKASVPAVAGRRCVAAGERWQVLVCQLAPGKWLIEAAESTPTGDQVMFARLTYSRRGRRREARRYARLMRIRTRRPARGWSR